MSIRVSQFEHSFPVSPTDTGLDLAGAIGCVRTSFEARLPVRRASCAGRATQAALSSGTCC